MSEKRFTVDDDGIYDTQEKKHFKFSAYDWMECDIYECCDLLNEQQAEIGRLKKELEPKFEDNQETEIRECQFCGEFRTEYHEYEDYSWSAEDYCNAGHYLEDTDPNTCKDYWDND